MATKTKHMKKTLIALIFVTLALSATAQLSIIDGKWTRRGHNEVALFAINAGKLERIATFNVNDNNFSFAFTPKQAGFFAIGSGNENAPASKHLFYFKPGDRLNVIVNDSTYVLTGQNTKENQALAAWQNYVLPIQIPAITPSIVSYVQYFPLLDETLENLEKWTKANLKPTGNRAFDEQFAKFRNYDLILYATSFVMSPRTMHPQGEDFSDFYREMKLTDLDGNTEILAYPFGLRLLRAVASVEIMLKGERMLSQQQFIDNVRDNTLKAELFLSNLETVRDMATLNVWMDKYEELLSTEVQKDRLRQYIATIQRIEQQGAQQPAARSQAAEQPSALVPGRPAPNFTYNDVNGNPVSLSDFKGKVVYIDVWATWCGPCRQQFPHLKTLKERYKDNDNIVIMGISGDAIRDIPKWKEMVEKEQLGGVQLHGRTDGDDDVAKLFGVTGFPTFILIDKQGNIVSAQAPRASSDEIVPMIERVLQQ